jgi:hypothetical protein
MKNYIKRAIRTFVQTAVGYLVVAVPTVDFSETSALKAIHIMLLKYNFRVCKYASIHV